jgi:Immunity protein 21
VTARKWVESAGGPLVLIERTAAQRWSGYRGDYDRACEVEDVLGVIQAESVAPSANVLVFGDEPLRTTFLPERNVVLQWIYASSEEELLAEVLALDLGEIEWEEGPEVSVSGIVEIFDAALPRDEASVDDVLSVELPGPVSRVMTKDVDLNAENSVRLHRLIIGS